MDHNLLLLPSFGAWDYLVVVRNLAVGKPVVVGPVQTSVARERGCISLLWVLCMPS